MALRPHRHLRNRQPRPALRVSPPAFNLMISAALNPMDHAQIITTWRSAIISDTDIDVEGWILVTKAGYSSDFLSINSGSEGNVVLINYGVDLSGPNAVTLYVLAQPPAVANSDPMVLGQSMDVTGL